MSQRSHEGRAQRRDGVPQLAPASGVTHVMAMSNDEILSNRSARSERTSRAAFRGAEAAGPIIDQEGREIPAESLGPQFRSFRFEFGNAGAHPFGNLTREQRLARLDAIAKLLDVAFILPGTNIRYGFDVLFRANIRNVRLLRRWMDKQPR